MRIPHQQGIFTGGLPITLFPALPLPVELALEVADVVDGGIGRRSSVGWRFFSSAKCLDAVVAVRRAVAGIDLVDIVLELEGVGL